MASDVLWLRSRRLNALEQAAEAYQAAPSPATLAQLKVAALEWGAWRALCVEHRRSQYRVSKARTNARRSTA